MPTAAKSRRRPKKQPAATTPGGDVIRNVINARLEQLGISRYTLARSGKSGMTEHSTYRYLNGATDTRGENIAAILEVLGLEIVPVSGFKPTL